jgi:hypothetical protein
MSYVVHVWEHAEPRTLQAADSIHNSLAGQSSRPNPKWRLLGERVEARLAELGTPLEEWPDGSPPDPAHAERTLPVLIDLNDQLLGVLVEIANSLGMSVYDDQAARLYLPFGYVLTWEGLRRLEVAPPKIVVGDLDDIMGACERAWAPRFAAHGYQFGRKPFDERDRAHILLAERAVPAGKQIVEVRFLTDQKANTIDANVYVGTSLELPALALAAAQGISRIEIRGKELRGLSALLVTMYEGREMLSIGGRLRSRLHADRLIDGLFEYYEQEVGPALEAMREPAGVLRVVLGEEDVPAQARNSRAALALAWVHGEAQLDRLMARIKERDPMWIEDWGQAVSEELRKVSR